jgi:phosphohistidine phosphatase SixA
VIVLLVRHARAGDRDAWEGDDRLRPLDAKGWKQAEGLVELLADYPLERLLSSPYLRCTQTFEALAPARGLEIEEVEELAEGSTRDEVLLLLGSGANGGESVAICTHGDVVVELIGDTMKKGAVEVLEVENGQLRRVRDLGRPSA